MNNWEQKWTSKDKMMQTAAKGLGLGPYDQIKNFISFYCSTKPSPLCTGITYTFLFRKLSFQRESCMNTDKL